MRHRPTFSAELTYVWGETWNDAEDLSDINGGRVQIHINFFGNKNRNSNYVSFWTHVIRWSNSNSLRIQESIARLAFPSLLCTTKFHFCVHARTPTDPVLSQMNPDRLATVHNGMTSRLTTVEAKFTCLHLTFIIGMGSVKYERRRGWKVVVQKPTSNNTYFPHGVESCLAS
jgi:hypothetical protein